MKFFGYITAVVCHRCVKKGAALAPARLSLQLCASLGQQNRESAFAVVGREPAQFVLSPKEQEKLEENLPTGRYGSNRTTGCPLLFWAWGKATIETFKLKAYKYSHGELEK